MDFNKTFFKYGVYYPVAMLKSQNVPRYLKELLKTEFLSKQELEGLQYNKLKKLIKYVKHYVPFYKDKMSAINKKDIMSINDINKLPFITKDMLKKSPENFISSEKFYFLTKKITSGSTGEPLTIYKTVDAMARELAATWRGYLWAGIDIGDRQGRFWGVPFSSKDKYKAKLIDFVCNRRRCSAFSFDQKQMGIYTKKLISFKPKYFYGYVSMLEEYAKYFKKNQKPSPFNLECIITTAEVLTDYHRELIGNVFSTKIFDEYGCGELGSVAHECGNGSMHIMAENMIVEVLNDNGPCRPGEIGELVITELNNRAMPLIRYKTGDFASISSKPCKCGRFLPIINKLAGRAVDVVKNKDGKLFVGNFFVYILKESKQKGLGVEAFQVIQIDYDKLKINVVPGSNYSKVTEDFITNRIRKEFGHDTCVEFEKIEKIRREPSGKMRVVVGMGNL
ncbi:MAG: phenylacetate--CoA ligase family protein [Desulfobacteraceae bacterium]|nr:phenylacetate--CoA ligase family protein [Desulfobacteraceae bacterium]